MSITAQRTHRPKRGLVVGLLVYLLYRALLAALIAFCIGYTLYDLVIKHIRFVWLWI